MKSIFPIFLKIISSQNCRFLNHLDNVAYEKLHKFVPKIFSIYPTLHRWKFFRRALGQILWAQKKRLEELIPTISKSPFRKSGHISPFVPTVAKYTFLRNRHKNWDTIIAVDRNWNFFVIKFYRQDSFIDSDEICYQLIGKV